MSETRVNSNNNGPSTRNQVWELLSIIILLRNNEFQESLSFYLFVYTTITLSYQRSEHSICKKRGRGKVGGKIKAKRKIYCVTQKEGMEMREIVIDENSLFDRAKEEAVTIENIYAFLIYI